MPQVPQSIDTEQALLGSMLVYPNTIITAYDQNLQPEEFYLESDRRIFNVIMDLQNENIPVDVTSVVTRLSDIQQLNAVGGVEYISHLTDMAVSSANSEYYIKTIQEKAILRKLIEVSQKVIDDAYNNSANAEEVLADAESHILAVTRNVKATDFTTSRAAMEQVLAQIRLLQQHKEMTGVRSGYIDLDRITYGFQKGDLIIMAARPSVGKTAFALNIAANAATKYGKAVALFSLEMPVLQLGMRILSANSGVDSYRIRTGNNLTNEDWAKIKYASDALMTSKLFIEDSASIKVNDIFAKCRKLKAEGNLDMIVIDYLQLITPSSRHSDNRQLEVSEISRSLKALARELDVPVIALSQLSRSVEQRSGDKRPILSDLRESGAIEQDADIVMFLHRPDYYDRDKKDEDEDRDSDARYEANIIIAKHRNGSIGEISLMFQPNTNAFLPLASARKENSEN